MASVFLCCSARPLHSIKLGFHQTPTSPSVSSSLNLHSTSIFRFEHGAKLVTKRRFPCVQASNKSSEEPVKAITSSETSNAQGPPFLTILAGIVVFALVLWVVGSIVSWVFGLFSLIFSK